MSNWKKAGVLGVDTGRCWLGDPGYVLTRDSGVDRPLDVQAPDLTHQEGNMNPLDPASTHRYRMLVRLRADVASMDPTRVQVIVGAAIDRITTPNGPIPRILGDSEQLLYYVLANDKIGRAHV